MVASLTGYVRHWVQVILTFGRFGADTEAHLAASFGASVGQTDFTKRIRPVTSVATPLQIGGFAVHFTKKWSEMAGRARRSN